MDNEPFQLQPPDSPFQVAIILKEIFSKLEFPDLARCRQVAKLWDCEASKQLWKVGRIRPFLYKWNFFGEADKSGHFANGNEILDTFQSRIPSSKESLISVKICLPTVSDSETFLKEYFYSHYHDVGISIHGFLTGPILCNILASIELEFFADLDVVLRLLSEVPNLREFSVSLDFGPFVSAKHSVPKWNKTSPVQKLKFDILLKEDKDELESWMKEEFRACIKVVLGGCVNLKDLELGTEYYYGGLFKVIDINFVTDSLKNLELVQALTLRGGFNWDEVLNTPLEKLQVFSRFSNITNLYLRDWGPVSLETWKSVMTNNCLPPYLERLECSVYNRADSLKKVIIYDHLVDAGLGRLRNLTWLKLDLRRGNWGYGMEQWQLVEERLALVCAKISIDRQSPIDLRPHKHLRDLKLVGDREGLTDALKVTPPTVKQLHIDFKMTDDDFIRDGALKAISSLESLRISSMGHGKHNVAILKHVFAEMKNLRVVLGLQFTERELQECGINNITFDMVRFVSGSGISASKYFLKRSILVLKGYSWVQSYENVLWNY